MIVMCLVLTSSTCSPINAQFTQIIARPFSSNTGSRIRYPLFKSSIRPLIAPIYTIEMEQSIIRYAHIYEQYEFYTLHNKVHTLLYVPCNVRGCVYLSPNNACRLVQYRSNLSSASCRKQKFVVLQMSEKEACHILSYLYRTILYKSILTSITL